MTFGVVLLMGIFSPELVVAQSQTEAQLVVRLQELEDTVRTLNGQVEGLQFQLTQMQKLIQKMQDDNEFRFQQLEGGGPGKNSATSQSGGVMPSAEASQAPAGCVLRRRKQGRPGHECLPGVIGVFCPGLTV